MMAHTNQVSLEDSTQKGVNYIYQLLQKSHLKDDEKIQLKFKQYCHQLGENTQSFLKGNVGTHLMYRNEIVRISYEIHYLISLGVKSSQLNEVLACQCIKNLELIREQVLMANKIFRYINN